MPAAKEKLSQHIEAAAASLAGFDERAMPLMVIARYIKERKS
jgi:geranylgeranyl diphosphate synthase type II